jgi:pyrroline-5-carboxylate reductase
MTRVVFLGSGRITTALVAGLKLASARYQVLVHDRNWRRMRQLERIYGALSEPDLRRAVAQADLLIVAVRPDSVPQLFRQIGTIKRPVLAVSVAAGIPLRQLISGLGPPVRWARAMPSPVSRANRGLTGLTFSRSLSPTDRARIRKFFAHFGEVIEIPEKKFDAFTVAYSPSHGYHALHTLALAAAHAGLDRKTALLAAAHALSDSIAAWRKSEHSLQSLLHEAATPGGIAAATMDAMDAAAYGRAVQRGISAGLQRARANAKKSKLVGNR